VTLPLRGLSTTIVLLEDLWNRHGGPVAPGDRGLLQLCAWWSPPVAARDMGVDSHHVVYPQAVKTMTNQVRRHRAAWG
jgi:hypothetical protein